MTPVIGLRSLWLDYGPCDWAYYPVIGFITPVIGSIYPCDWTSVPVIGFYPCVLGFWFGVGFGMMIGVRFGGWCWEFLSVLWLWVFVYSVDISLFSIMIDCSLFLCSVGILVMTRCCLMLSSLNFGFIRMSFGYNSFSLLLLSIRFELLYSSLVFIFYMGV